MTLTPLQLAKALYRRLPPRVRFVYRIARNRLHVLRRPRAWLRSIVAIRRIRVSLVSLKAELAGYYGRHRIPDIIHFVYGFTPDEVFPYFAYVAVSTALRNNPSSCAVVHFCHEPRGKWWDATRPMVRLHQVPNFSFFRGAPLYHFAHKTDVMRLLALHELGGIYLDTDMLTLLSFAPLQDDEFVMGVQPPIPGGLAGLCNAAILAAPGSRFLARWIAEYAHFRSRGRDVAWDVHSVRLPLYLYQTTALPITVLPHYAFYPVMWGQIRRFLLAPGSVRHREVFADSFAVHLWNHENKTALADLDPDTRGHALLSLFGVYSGAFDEP